MSSATISSLAAGCQRLIQDCTLIPSLMEQERAENRLADFNLWASGIGALGKHRASLDNRLSFEPDVQTIVINLLVTFSNVIEQCKRLGSDHENNHVQVPRGEDGMDTDDEEMSDGYLGRNEPFLRSLSPWSDASMSNLEEESSTLQIESASSLQKAMRNTDTLFDQLIRLGIAIRKSGRASRLQKADSRFDPVTHQELEKHMILLIFAKPSKLEIQRKEMSRDPLAAHTDILSECNPDSNQLTEVQKRLVRANLIRRNRFVYAQSHATKLAEINGRKELRESLPMSDIGTIVQENQSYASHEMANSLVQPVIQDRIEDMTKTKTLDTRAKTGTTASEVKSKIAFDTSSSYSASQQAKTTVSTTITKLAYPQPPEAREGLRSFKCPCCCQTLPIMMRERSHWRKHLAEDVSPYVCPLESCEMPNLFYVTRLEWISHMQQEHRLSKSWECTACEEELKFPDIDQFLSHMRIYHGQTISEQQILVLASLSEKTTLLGLTHCPLCSWVEEQQTVDEDSILNHVAEHMHSFSLLSLPWTRAQIDYSPANLARSEQKVNEWFSQWPTSQPGVKYRPRLPFQPKEPEQIAKDYFETNDYFADDVGRSLAANNESSSSGASMGLAPDGVQSEPDQVFSRPATETEMRAFHDFEVHTHDCTKCHYRLDDRVRRHIPVFCTEGYDLAEALASYVYTVPGGDMYDIYSRGRRADGNNQAVSVQVPAEYEKKAHSLLKIINRHSRHLNREKFRAARSFKPDQVFVKKKRSHEPSPPRREALKPISQTGKWV